MGGERRARAHRSEEGTRGEESTDRRGKEGRGGGGGGGSGRRMGQNGHRLWGGEDPSKGWLQKRQSEDWRQRRRGFEGLFFLFLFIFRFFRAALSWRLEGEPNGLLLHAFCLHGSELSGSFLFCLIFFVLARGAKLESRALCSTPFCPFVERVALRPSVLCSALLCGPAPVQTGLLGARLVFIAFRREDERSDECVVER